jgi:thioredoxin-like negative regulator of GroEL
MESSGLPYQKVNTDNETVLTKQFGIRNIPTLVKVDSNGSEISRLSGNRSLNEIQSWYNG